MTRRHPPGFTLLELLIALSIVGALLAVAFGGLRVALAAWRQGEDRAEAHQYVRGLASSLAHAVEGAHPYRAPLGLAPEPALLFQGTASKLQFVTRSSPYPFSIPIAFTAVVVSVETGEKPGLVVRQRALPNRNPFADAEVRLTDPAVTALTFRYLDASGSWRDSWDAEAEQAIPDGVEITVAAVMNGRATSVPPLTVAIRTTKP